MEENIFVVILYKLLVQNSINGMIEESKFCTTIMKKHFNKELVMTKEDDQDFENSNKCSKCDNVSVEGDGKVRDHCHMTGKYNCNHESCIHEL